MTGHHLLKHVVRIYILMLPLYPDATSRTIWSDSHSRGPDGTSGLASGSCRLARAKRTPDVCLDFEWTFLAHVWPAPELRDVEAAKPRGQGYHTLALYCVYQLPFDLLHYDSGLRVQDSVLGQWLYAIFFLLLHLILNSSSLFNHLYYFIPHSDGLEVPEHRLTT